MTGIGGVTEGPVSHSFVNFHVPSTRSRGGRTKDAVSGIDATVLPRITTTLPAYHIDFDSKWEHLQCLHLADPQFDVQGPTDVLLSADVFDKVIRHGRRRASTALRQFLKDALGGS